MVTEEAVSGTAHTVLAGVRQKYRGDINGVFVDVCVSSGYRDETVTIDSSRTLVDSQLLEACA